MAVKIWARNPSIVIVMTITMIIVFQKDCSPLPDRQVFLVQRGEGGRLGRTEAPTEYDSHDNIVWYHSQDNMMMIRRRITFQSDPEEDESDGDREDDYDDDLVDDDRNLFVPHPFIYSGSRAGRSLRDE